MILIWNLDQYLNMSREIRERQKKIDNDDMLSNFDVIYFLPIKGQFAAIRKLDSQCMLYETYIFINNNLWS